MGEDWPFAVSSRAWDELSERERNFCCGDHHLPLHPQHAAQLRLLNGEDARCFASWAWSAVPAGWPDQADRRFARESALNLLQQSWSDTDTKAMVQRWLYEQGIPFRRTVYLIYERDCVVQTTWRMVVRYWDAFAWSVGYGMVTVDHTLRWAVCFHHEDVFAFGSHQGPCAYRAAATKRH